MAESGGNSAAEDMVDVYEKMFKHRYTDEDEEYVKTRDTPLANPPCVENWYQRPKRTFDFTRGQRGGRGGRGGYGRDQRDRYHGHDSHRHQGWDNRDRRGRGGGGGWDQHGRDRVHYAGRRDDRHHPYDHGNRHQQGQHRQGQQQGYGQHQRHHEGQRR